MGRVVGEQDGKLLLAPDLKENLTKSDQLEVCLIQMIDEFIIKTGLEAPIELRDAYASAETTVLDLEREGIAVIIWAMGYRFDYSWVRLPVFDDSGFPIAPYGATRRAASCTPT